VGRELRRPAPGGDRLGGDAGHQIGKVEMLFESDDPHGLSASFAKSYVIHFSALQPQGIAEHLCVFMDKRSHTVTVANQCFDAYTRHSLREINSDYANHLFT
jgi:hypothetical protein